MNSHIDDHDDTVRPRSAETTLRCCECDGTASLVLKVIDGVPLCWPCWKRIEQVVAGEEMTDGRL